MRRYRHRLVGILLMLCVSSYAYADDIMIKESWVRAGPPTATSLAGYLVIENHRQTPIALVGAKSANFQKVEIHRSSMKDGMMRMTQEKRLTIGVHKRLEFAPGGLHLMLIMPKQTLKEGDAVTITLIFENGAEKTYETSVKKDAGTRGHHHGAKDDKKASGGHQH